MSDALMTKKQVAEFLQVSTRFVERLIAGDKLAALKVGRLVRIARSEVERFLKGGRKS